jgi:putative hydrolase of the HAD superfamily
MTYKNIVFDVGNVLVRWDPQGIIDHVFPEHTSPHQLMLNIFKDQTWYDLNLGSINEREAIYRYHQQLGIDATQLEYLLQTVKESLSLISGSVELLERLYNKPYNLYALTDNTVEIMAYLKNKYSFWPLFKGIVVSAEIGYLKPSKEIYHYLLEHHKLQAHETVFIDDVSANVEGAKAIGIEAIQFTHIKECIEALRDLKIDTR